MVRRGRAWSGVKHRGSCSVVVRTIRTSDGGGVVYSHASLSLASPDWGYFDGRSGEGTLDEGTTYVFETPCGRTLAFRTLERLFRRPGDPASAVLIFSDPDRLAASGGRTPE